MRTSRVAVAAALVWLGACTSPQQQAQRAEQQQNQQAQAEARARQAGELVPFDEEQARQAMVSGSGSLRGVLFHKVILGGVDAGKDPQFTFRDPVLVPNAPVYLYPSTAHLQDLLRQREAAFRDLKQTSPKTFRTDERLEKYVYRTRSDAQGRFAFSRLAAGRYHLMAEPVLIDMVGVRVDSTAYVDRAYGAGIFGGAAAIAMSGIRREYEYTTEKRTRRLEYGGDVEIKAGHGELVVDARMRVPDRNALFR